MGAKIKALESALETEQAKTDDLYRSLRRALTAADEASRTSADLQARLDGVNAQLRGLERENERMRGYLDSEAEARVCRMVIKGVALKDALTIADEERSVRELAQHRHNRLGSLGGRGGRSVGDP